MSSRIFCPVLCREDNKGTAYRSSSPDESEIAAAEEVRFQLVSLEALQDLQDEDPEIKLIT